MKIHENHIEMNGSDLNDPAQMDMLQQIMDAANDAYVQEIQKIAETFNISDGWAANIRYLRSRSRWTQELEDRLLQMARNNEPSPNMCEWP